MMQRYVSKASVLGAVIVTYTAFGFLFPLVKRMGVIDSKPQEVLLFFVMAGVALVGWLAACSARKAEPEQVIEPQEARIEKVSRREMVWWFVGFLGIYLIAMWWGTGSSRVAVDVFNEHKEFGLHLDAIVRMNHGAFPWFDFAYPYGLYPITAAWLLWQLVGHSGALVYTALFLNICAVILFMAVIRRYASAMYIRPSVIWLLVYVSSALVLSGYHGLQANWLRYLSPLLIVIAWPAAEQQKPFRALLFGLVTSFVFFIAPELAPFVAAMAVIALLHLWQRHRWQACVWYLAGLLLSCLPAIVLWGGIHPAQAGTVFNHIFYQSTFILQHGKLANNMPDLFSLVANLLWLNPSLDSLLAVYFGLLFYLPLAFVIWSAGWLWLYRQVKTLRWYAVFTLTVAVFVVFLKSLGSSGLGYAFLTMPLVMVLLVLLLSLRPALNRYVVVAFSIVLVSSAGYGFQQQLFPCLLNTEGHACQYLQRKRDISKEAIFIPGANAVQKFFEDEVADFEKLITTLRSVPGKILVLSDFTALYYYVNQPPPGMIMLPTLYLPGADLREIEALSREAAAVIIPDEDYNFINNLDSVFKTVLKEVKRNFTYAGSCGGQHVYLRTEIVKTMDSTEELLCEKMPVRLPD